MFKLLNILVLHNKKTIPTILGQVLSHAMPMP